MSDDLFDFVPEFRSVSIPRQKQPHAPSPAACPSTMDAPVSCYPPLDQVTQIEGPDVSFFVILHVEHKQAHASWQLCLWHSHACHEWQETPLSRAAASDAATVFFNASEDSKVPVCFRASLRLPSSPLEFTVKFRAGSDLPWTWVRDVQGSQDGVVIPRPPRSLTKTASDLSHVISGLNPQLAVKSVLSQAPRTELWTIEAVVAAASPQASSYADVTLGTPWGGSFRWFALVRQASPWLAPRHGKAQFDVDSDALMCSFLAPHGKHLVLLGLSGANSTMTLMRGSGLGPVNLHLRNDGESERNGILLAAVGDDFENAVAAVMYHARKVSASSIGSPKARQPDVVSLEGSLEPQRLEEWYDGLGYCTWNALGQDLTDDKIVQAVKNLEEGGIHIKSLIIDDNWQDIDCEGDSQFQHGWNSFEAHPQTFPRGLADTVSRIRAANPSIQHVAVWHALFGYWGGISPSGKLAQEYKTVEVARENSPKRDMPLEGTMTVIAEEDIDRFYSDFYHFLSQCGVDAAKTDVQFMMDSWTSPRHRQALTNATLDAWTNAALRYFNMRTISCMSQAPQIIFHQQIARSRPPMPMRTSDDFFPNVPAAQPWHLWANAHNSLLTQHLNVLPDWDMFQTKHEDGAFHAAARCLSGGPIYITDPPGSHDMGLIKEMTGRTPRGNTIIFRPSVAGKTIDQYFDYHDNVLLKIGSYHGHAVTGTPFLGLFNVSPESRREAIPLFRFPDVVSSVRYIVRAHTTGRVGPIMLGGSHASLTGVALSPRGHEILTAFPLTQFDSAVHGRVHVACLGLLGKLTGAAATTSFDFDFLPNGRVFLDIRLKALGVLGLYISALPELSAEKDFLITIQGQVIPPRTVSINQVSDVVMDVDIEAAWDELELQTGWNNEVEVKVYFQIDH